MSEPFAHTILGVLATGPLRARSAQPHRCVWTVGAHSNHGGHPSNDRFSNRPRWRAARDVGYRPVRRTVTTDNQHNEPYNRKSETT